MKLLKILAGICFLLSSTNAQQSGPAQLKLTQQTDSISFLLTNIPGIDQGAWVLQSSTDLKTWEDLAFFEDSPNPEMELANTLLPQPDGDRQFFRARYLEVDNRRLRAFLTARELWRISGISGYTMQVAWFPSFFSWQGTVTVDNGQVTSSEIIFTNFFEPPEPRTMDDWFDQLKRYIDLPADTIIVTYDPVYGYPKSVAVDQSVLIADEEESWTVQEFTPAL